METKGDSMKYPDTIEKCHEMIDRLFDQINLDEINKNALRSTYDLMFNDLYYWKNMYKELCDSNTNESLNVIIRTKELSNEAIKMIADLDAIQQKYISVVSPILSKLNNNKE